MNGKTDIQKLVQISKMYYEQGLTQEQISKELGISRSAVSMILTEAKKMKIVDIRIKDPYVNNEKLAKRFKTIFGLEECIVVPTSISSGQLLLKIVTSRAAVVAAEKMRSHSTVGMAWGSTCYEVIQQFPSETGLFDINVVPLIGGSSLVSAEYQINETVRQFAEKLYGSPQFIYSPGIVENVDDKKNFLDSLYMQSVMEKWHNLDFAIVGIGAPPEYYGTDSRHFDMQGMAEKIQENKDRPIGDFAARRFNIRGEFLDCDHNDRVIAADGEDLRRTKQVLGIACGMKKVYSIIGALNSKILTYLVVDELTAAQALAVLDEGMLDEAIGAHLGGKSKAAKK